MRRIAALLALGVLCSAVAAQSATQAPASTNVVTASSASPLYQIEIMVRAGSADDATGKEGTASLLGQMLIEGGFGDAKNPTTKEKLAEITRPWGTAAVPSVLVDKEATTFSMTVPRDAWPQFVQQVLKPMFQQPLFLAPELDRLRREALSGIRSTLRLEDQETLGLEALDAWVFAGTPLDFPAAGTVQGLQAVTRDDLAAFYKQHYTRARMFIAASITDPAALQTLTQAFPAGVFAETTEKRPQAPVVEGRHVLIITQPNAIATALHLGFPIGVTRADADYWPLFVANTAFGVHRDSFAKLYQEIREERGYNYGDYSYMEYYYGRPAFLFPPPNTPRSSQYFSMWARPVGHQYTHFIMKALTAELDNLIKSGLMPQEVEGAKVKARTLYLNYAASHERQLGYRLDDLFYGMRDRGYLQTMLQNIDAVTPEQVNAAIRKHLQLANLKYVIVTNESVGTKLAEDIANNANVTTKTLEEYHISEPVPPDKQKMLAQDKEWAAYPLNIPRGNIRVVKAEQMFETRAIPGVSAAK